MISSPLGRQQSQTPFGVGGFEGPSWVRFVPASPRPLLVPSVQMEPSFGFFWSPSRSVFESRCVGLAAVFCGAKHSCQSLPRRRRAGDPQHDGHMDLAVSHAHNTSRFEIVADGLPLFDTTLMSALHCDGSARRGAAHRDGVALVAARRKKERTCLELVGPHARARLLVLAGEGVGRDTIVLVSWPGRKHGVQVEVGFGDVPRW